MRQRTKETIVGGTAVGLIGLLACCGIRSIVTSDDGPKRPPAAAASPSANALPAPSGEAFGNPRFNTLAAIGSSIARRWHEAAPTNRTVNVDTPLNASVTVKAAGKCTVKLAMSANGPTNQDPGSFYINPGAGGSVSASVECPGKRPIGLGASIGPDGVLRTYWSQANTQVDTTGNKAHTSDPVQPLFTPDAAPKIQDETIAQLNALSQVQTDGSLPKLPKPTVPVIPPTLPPSPSRSA